MSDVEKKDSVENIVDLKKETKKPLRKKISLRIKPKEKDEKKQEELNLLAKEQQEETNIK